MSDARRTPVAGPAGAVEASDEPLIRVEGLTKYFDNTSGFLEGWTLDLDGGGSPITRESELVKAVEDVTFEIQRGETLGLVGESGCGKSTLARTILQLIKPTEGAVYFDGEDLTAMSSSEVRSRRQDIQMIFQDPQSSLDPRMKIGTIVEEPMKAHGMLDDEGREDRAKELLEKVGLDPQHYNRYPYAFSGGQRQRVNLARALSVNPDFIVCDEPVSALDVSIQAQVLNTMNELQEEFGLTYLFIAHDLSVIRHISDRVAVMYLGQLVELADKEELFENPQHPYTEALLKAIPSPDPRATETRGVLEGDVPSPIDPPSGCRFRTRCPRTIAPTEANRPDIGGDSFGVAAAAELPEHRVPQIWDFVRAVRTHEFETVERSFVVNRFFEGRLPDANGPVGEVLEEAIGALQRDDWDGAATTLETAFPEGALSAAVMDTYELSDEQWADVREFVRAVDRRTFEPETEAEVTRQFFDRSLPGGRAGEILSEAITNVLADEWGRAAELLRRSFTDQSVCAKVQPSYEIGTAQGSNRHFSACHLHHDAIDADLE